MRSLPEIAKIEIKDRIFEEEAKDFKNFSDLLLAKGLLYLKFINEKGLMREFDNWRKKRIFEVI